MITLEHAQFSYGNKQILEDFSLEIPDTGITVLHGPSGCGKTTLLRILGGLAQLQKGEILGISQKNTAFLFQENRLLPWRTAMQHITDTTSKSSKIPPEFYLQLVELEGEGSSFPGSLSGGMARRLALARCLALDSDCLLLDEPFTGVDPERALRILRRIRGLGKPVVLVSHQTSVLTEADKILTLSGPPLRSI